MADATTSVDLFFDPICPFTWVTSRWLLMAAEQKGFTVNARPFCLKFKNEEAPQEVYAKSHDIGLRTLRVFLAVEDELGNRKAQDLYTEFGYAHFPADLQADAPDMSAVLTAAGIETKFAAAADDASLDERLRSELAAATDLAGNDVGAPIIAIEGTGRGFFGPVITELPNEENTGKLWDAVETLFTLPELREFKRDNRKFPQAPARTK